jgi:hypothetical protein
MEFSPMGSCQKAGATQFAYNQQRTTATSDVFPDLVEAGEPSDFAERGDLCRSVASLGN